MQAFDSIASNYDDAFTNTAIGQLQRARVWHFVDKLLNNHNIRKVLELNCGTGEDALRLSQKVDKVHATDISGQMIAEAQQKAVHTSPTLSFQQLSIDDLDSLDGAYDLIFSNFGGFNCLSPDQIKKLSFEAQRLLRPGGRMVAVIMARFCWWEFWYFLLKRQGSNVFRRRHKHAIPAALDANNSIDTYYYNPREFYSLMAQHFKLERCDSVGYFLPPSYLEPFFVKRPRLLRFLNKLEYLVPKGSFFSAASDHYILQLQKL